MTKKLIVIVLLLLVIFANIQVCYADSTIGDYPFNEYNPSIKYFGNNTRYINYASNYLFESIGLVYGSQANLIPFFSRYNSGKVHIELEFNLQLFYYYKLVNTNLTPKTTDFGSWTLDTTNYTIQNYNFDITFNDISEGVEFTSYYYKNARCKINISFDTFLKDLRTNVPQHNEYTYIRIINNTANINPILISTTNEKMGYLHSIYLTNESYAKYKFTFDNSINQTIGGYFGYNFEHFVGYTGVPGFHTNNGYTKNYFNFENNPLTDSKSYFSNLSSFSTPLENRFVSMSNSSSYEFNSYLCQIDESSYWQDAYSMTNASAIMQNYTYYIEIQPPVFFANSEEIVNIFNDNKTQIELQYYDCEWWQIHLQLANAFIFMITEFPLLSDITNLIYSLFVMIKGSFDVLLQFNGFGVIFGVAMFAIVFGFILKLIIGD